jgi:hypothetical protein
MSVKDNQSQQESKSNSSDLNIKYTFRLAITLIIGFLIFFAAMIAWDFVNVSCPTCEKFEGIEKLTSTLGPIIAGIVGFYFGQKPTQELIKQNQEVTTEKDKYKSEAVDSLKVIEKDKKDLKDFRDQVDKLMKKLETG